jgi:hypothetical protein
MSTGGETKEGKGVVLSTEESDDTEEGKRVIWGNGRKCLVTLLQ